MASIASDELLAAAHGIIDDCGYTSAVLAGIVPDQRHKDNGGYHCSVNDLIAYGNDGDYSNTDAADKGWNPKYSAAIDVAMSKKDMVTAYGRVHAVWADKADPRRKYFNAVNGWDGTGDAIRLDFDRGTSGYASPDHQTHDHIEIHRRYVRDPKAARAAVSMYRGESKAAWIAREETKPAQAQGDDDMADEFKLGKQPDGTPTSWAGHVVLSQGIPNGLKAGAPRDEAWEVLRDLGVALGKLQKSVDQLAAKVTQS